MDYKDTLNLYKTSFPMKANLPVMEPQLLERWEREGIYGLIRKRFAGRAKYILHDGPPYANGHIHLGTALNKILKDIVVKVKTMEGYDAVYVPGWDCHGLPIEHQVDKELGGKKAEMATAAFRKACRKFAGKFVDIQREEFKRLGVFGDWDNPYLTMSYSYEADTIRELGKFMARGSVYKGLKPVHWCISCRTALAEAEVEYHDSVSPSIYVKFPLAEDARGALPGLKSGEPSVLIWTTTPWTLPANQAVALHPYFRYAAVSAGGEVYIVAAELVEQVMKECGIGDYEVLEEFQGGLLEGKHCHHPFYDREPLFVLADYVTLEQGTGCVHTAPGHGREDYETGIKYGLEVYNPVDDGGKFVPGTGMLDGMTVFEGDEEVCRVLEENGRLLKQEKLTHSYPHCWRCKEPVIFRATAQWFISMDSGDLRAKALEEIKRVRWIPAWGQDRIYGMIENRPDWCISRQRAWGVPITAFYCLSCGTTLQSQEISSFVADQVEKEGADLWFDREPAQLLPPGTVCPQCGGADFRKETDILDVWFDSGVSQAAVLESREDLLWPADMYLEGSDQHRGWFHSSLLAAVGTRGKAPYHAVLTHGYVVDGEGRKMSKSLGNVIEPEQVIEKYGAEILRLWVASENYQEDIRISEEILQRLSEAYRKIRNTFRFLLMNLTDFDPSEDLVAYGELEELDRFMLHKLNRLIVRIRDAYHRHEYHTVYHSLHNYCVVELSSFYLDIVKDRLYTFSARSTTRRGAQTVMHHNLMALVKLMAPILTFTADEIWGYLPQGSAEESGVHLSEFPAPEEGREDEELAEKWGRIQTLRREVTKGLEEARRRKLVGHSLDAHLDLYLSPPLHKLLESVGGELNSVFIVSSVALHHFQEKDGDAWESEELPGLAVAVKKAAGEKCERCWIYSESVGENEEHPTICSKCVANL
jgi:isoleucyl-tRNA synthetase